LEATETTTSFTSESAAKKGKGELAVVAEKLATDPGELICLQNQGWLDGEALMKGWDCPMEKMDWERSGDGCRCRELAGYRSGGI